jgi:hypothetical protein
MFVDNPKAFLTRQASKLSAFRKRTSAALIAALAIMSHGKQRL